MDELRWIIGLNLVLAIWLGMLADSWKGRRLYVWMGIGFVTSLLGLALLSYLPKVERRRKIIALPLALNTNSQFTDESDNRLATVP